MRSKVTRRMSARLSAGGAGVNPALSSLARMKLSSGERHHAAFFTCGGAAFISGWNAQCFDGCGGSGGDPSH